jgi:hypothetical protein
MFKQVVLDKVTEIKVEGQKQFYNSHVGRFCLFILGVNAAGTMAMLLRWCFYPHTPIIGIAAAVLVGVLALFLYRLWFLLPARAAGEEFYRKQSGVKNETNL